ncbi:MAG: hypothetical protein JXK93_07810 [Sphaerochaetaceae bacterium]|nr:hypothetical protein [Sphaerochaetaceae bacterium]
MYSQYLEDISIEEKLSQTEMLIASYIAQGLSNEEIAETVPCNESMDTYSVDSIKKIISLLFSKGFKHRSRASVAAWFSRLSTYRELTGHHTEDPVLEGFHPINEESGAFLPGIWLSCYQINASGDHKEDRQYGIEHITLNAEGHITGRNVQIASSLGYPHRHTLVFQYNHGKYYTGSWMNSNTNHYGLFMLKLLNNRFQMDGRYMGNDEELKVSGNPWRWIKLAEQEDVCESDPDNVRIHYERVDTHFDQWFKNARRITLSTCTQPT